MKGSTFLLASAGFVAAVAGAAVWFVQERSPDAQHREIVRLHLNDPDSAVFRNTRPAARGGPGVWCGELNAKNRMGGMVGFTRYVAELPGEGLGTTPEDAKLLSKVTFDESAGFGAKWDLMCR